MKNFFTIDNGYGTICEVEYDDKNFEILSMTHDGAYWFERAYEKIEELIGEKK